MGVEDEIVSAMVVVMSRLGAKAVWVNFVVLDSMGRSTHFERCCIYKYPKCVS